MQSNISGDDKLPFSKLALLVEMTQSQNTGDKRISGDDKILFRENPEIATESYRSNTLLKQFRRKK